MTQDVFNLFNVQIVISTYHVKYMHIMYNKVIQIECYKNTESYIQSSLRNLKKISNYFKMTIQSGTIIWRALSAHYIRTR